MMNNISTTSFHTISGQYGVHTHYRAYYRKYVIHSYGLVMTALYGFSLCLWYYKLLCSVPLQYLVRTRVTGKVVSLPWVLAEPPYMNRPASPIGLTELPIQGWWVPLGSFCQPGAGKGTREGRSSVKSSRCPSCTP